MTIYGVEGVECRRVDEGDECLPFERNSEGRIGCEEMIGEAGELISEALKLLLLYFVFSLFR